MQFFKPELCSPRVLSHMLCKRMSLCSCMPSAALQASCGPGRLPGPPAASARLPGSRRAASCACPACGHPRLADGVRCAHHTCILLHLPRASVQGSAWSCCKRNTNMHVCAHAMSLCDTEATAAPARPSAPVNNPCQHNCIPLGSPCGPEGNTLSSRSQRSDVSFKPSGSSPGLPVGSALGSPARSACVSAHHCVQYGWNSCSVTCAAHTLTCVTVTACWGHGPRTASTTSLPGMPAARRHPPAQRLSSSMSVKLHSRTVYSVGSAAGPGLPTGLGGGVRRQSGKRP
jgi:hypothetical protein